MNYFCTNHTFLLKKKNMWLSNPQTAILGPRKSPQPRVRRHSIQVDAPCRVHHKPYSHGEL